jgi:tRNA dimethylallyltransferase
MQKSKKIFILLGPTASGKSEIVYKLIQTFPNLQIINCDSKQIYREIPKITAQPDQNEILKYNYKLYGYRSIYENYNVSQWLEDANNEISSAFLNHKIPFLIGGTGFYINGLLNKMSDLPKISEEIKLKHLEMIERLGIEKYYQYIIQKDPLIIGKIHPNDKYRLHRAGCIFDQSGKSIFNFYQEYKIQRKSDYDYKINILLPEKEILYKNIEKRFHEMINNNLLNEVSQIIDIPQHLPSYKSHGLPELIDYINKKQTLDNAIEIAIKNTKNYAKRQSTWFRNQLKNENFFYDKNSCLKEIMNSLSNSNTLSILN